jgi:hypothetical protein
MTPDDYRKAAELFTRACQLPDNERSAFVARSCGDTPKLFQAVTGMLAHDAAGPEETVAFGDAATLEFVSDTTDAADDSTPILGRTFAGYELLEELGSGGMGVVYKARQLRPERLVALKTIRGARFVSQDDIQRFVNESKAAGNLQHPGVVPVFDAGCENGVHYFSMQYVEGMTLADALSSETHSREQLLEILLPVCQAVAHCHQHGVVHRDLKPSNILLDEGGQPKITDFGLARHLDNQSTLTVPGEIMGTPGYMPPEQAAGSNGSSGPPADVYSLGAILYHMLTGRPPVLAQDVNLAGAIRLIREHDVVAPRALQRSIPRDLDTICWKCLQKDPTQRYPQALELADDLKRYLDGEPIQARGLSWFGLFMRWARQQPGLAVTWIAIALFYVWHLLHYYVLTGEPKPIAFHVWSTLFAVVWATGAWGFQRALLTYGGRSRILFAWATMDVLLLTLYLCVGGIQGATSGLALLYFPIVAASSLRFRPDLVAYVTLLSLTGYVLHVWRNNSTELPDVSLDQSVPFALCLVTIGVCQYFTLRRSRFAIESLQRKP